MILLISSWLKDVSCILLCPPYIIVMCEVFPVIWNVGFRKNITRVINAVFKKKDDPEVQEPLRFVRPNAKWSKSPEPVVLIDPDTGEEFVDFPEETIPERIRKVLDSFW